MKELVDVSMISHLYRVRKMAFKLKYGEEQGSITPFGLSDKFSVKKPFGYPIASFGNMHFCLNFTS